MARIFIIFFLISKLIFADPLSIDEAFKVNISGDRSHGINIDFVIDKKSFIYKDRLKIKLQDQEITQYLNLPSPKYHDEDKIYSPELNLFIPTNLLKKFIKNDEFSLALSYQGCSFLGFCYQPVQRIYNISYDNDNLVFNKSSQNSQEKIASSFMKSHFLGLFSFFWYGLLLSLTPCVFPMIPIVWGIILSRKAHGGGFFISLVYVLSMSLAYCLAGILAGLFGGGLSYFLQTPAFIIIFSGIFVVLALSMFGFYDIELPKKFQAYISQRARSGSGIIGVAIMGFFSALILSPCLSAPLAGALIYIANTRDFVFGGLALFIMSLGMGVPLLIIGFGSEKFLPKPGAWMQEIKKIFGFLMLVMAIWMLKRLVGDFIGNLLYAILGIFFAVYIGAFKSPNNAKERFLKSAALVIFIISATCISVFVMREFKDVPKNKLNFVYIKNLNDLERLIKQDSKPVMLDFWASWCESCKELEDKTFGDPKVIDRLSNFTLAKIDVSKNTTDDIEMMKKFKVFGPPTLVFYKDKNELKDRQIVGFVAAEEFLNILGGI